LELGPVADLGDITAIDIGHDGTGFGSGWHCDYVEITNPAKPDVRYFFPAQSWFDLSVEPKQQR
jgi:hypothetical protein